MESNNGCTTHSKRGIATDTAAPCAEPSVEETAFIAQQMGWEYDQHMCVMVGMEDGNIVEYDWPSLDAMHRVEEVDIQGVRNWNNYVICLARARGQEQVTGPVRRIKDVMPTLIAGAGVRERIRAYLDHKNFTGTKH